MITATLGPVTEKGENLRDKALAKLSTLPPFSPILNKLVASMTDENVSFSQLGDLIEKDTVLAGNVLRLVNSAIYARRGTINSVRHAVSILGLAKLRNAAMSMSLGRLWNAQLWPPGWIPSQFNLHGVASAVMADLLAAEMETDYAEGAFAAGLLQNVGMLLIVTGLKEEFARLKATYLSDSALGLVETERITLGFDHSDLSERILRQWNLPEPIRLAAANHHAPNAKGLARVIQAADGLVERYGVLAQSWHRPPHGTVQDVFDGLGLGEKADGVMRSFVAEYDALKAFF